MRKSLSKLVLALSLLCSGGALAQDFAGDWNGTLTVSPGIQFPIAIHLRKAPSGGLEGTIDSPDQGTYDRPLSAVSITDNKLTFSDAPRHVDYAGTYDASAKAWKGQMTLGGRSLPLDFTAGRLPDKPTIAGLDGDWDGTLQPAPNMQLRLAFHIKSGPHGTLGTFDSIDQQAMGLGISGIAHDGPQVRFDMKVLNASFQGTLDASGQTITGQWSQLGANMALVLKLRPKGEVQATLNRPQTPVKPYPYREEEVAYDSTSGVRLAGTLTLPRGTGPFPAVVLVAGSGPNTRNEPILGHQLFLVLADHLTRHGIAVLRYDKRGTGASTGSYISATTSDFAADAGASLTYLRGRQEIDRRHVGLIGHSEGGLIAPMVAARDPNADFIVMLAGPGVDGAAVLTEQGRLITKAMGLPDSAVEEGSALRSQMIAIVRSETNHDVAAQKLRTLLAAYAKAHQLPDAVVDMQVNQVNSEWFRFFFNYDPAPTLRQVKCPVLALFGSKDLQVPPGQNLEAVRTALAGNRDAEIEEIPNLNHLFQTATTGSPTEYGRIEETMASVALETVTTWIQSHVGGVKRN